MAAVLEGVALVLALVMPAKIRSDWERIVFASVEEATTWLRLSRRVPPRERLSPEEWTDTTKRLFV